MEKIKTLYKESYLKYGKSKEALFWPKGMQYERFELLTQHIQNDNFSILDFGCGFGDLKNYLNLKFNNFKYLGVDVVDEFINENKKISDSDFLLIDDSSTIDEKFDNICISGTFNINYFESNYNKHKEHVEKILEKLFYCNLSDNGVLSF